MKHKSQVKSRARGPLHHIQHLNLSSVAIATLQDVTACEHVEILYLQRNCLATTDGLASCRNLWYLDLSCNNIWSLEGLESFIALGTLILGKNKLTWQELLRIQKIEILELSLQGNPALDRDEHYRKQVVDALPKVWVLDSHLVTFAERAEVEEFFAESALSEKPVRRKVRKEPFVPTNMKNLLVNGVFGHRTTHLRTKIPLNEIHNEVSDRRRVSYLVYNLQTDAAVESTYAEEEFPLLTDCPNFMEEMIKLRESQRIPSNMVIVLLLGSLEFVFPVRLLVRTLDMIKLEKLGPINVVDLFKLPKEVRLRVVSVLMNHIVAFKEIGEDEGMYEQLYLSLYSCVTDLTRLVHGGQKSYYHKRHLVAGRCLIASEIVQLMCTLPEFYVYLLKDEDVRGWVALATRNKSCIDSVMQILHANSEKLDDVQKDVTELLLTGILTSTFSLAARQSVWAGLNQSIALQPKFDGKHPLPFPLYVSNYHESGRHAPFRKAANVRTGVWDRRRYIPLANIGDMVLLGPQMVGRVIAIPEPEILLVQIAEVPDNNGAMVSRHLASESHYQYINQDELAFDKKNNFWRVKGSTGDRVTVDSVVGAVDHVITPRSRQQSARVRLQGGTPTSLSPYERLERLGTLPQRPVSQPAERPRKESVSASSEPTSRLGSAASGPKKRLDLNMTEFHTAVHGYDVERPMSSDQSDDYLRQLPSSAGQRSSAGSPALEAAMQKSGMSSDDNFIVKTGRRGTTPVSKTPRPLSSQVRDRRHSTDEPLAMFTTDTELADGESEVSRKIQSARPSTKQLAAPARVTPNPILTPKASPVSSISSTPRSPPTLIMDSKQLKLPADGAAKIIDKQPSQPSSPDVSLPVARSVTPPINVTDIEADSLNTSTHNRNEAAYDSNQATLDRNQATHDYSQGTLNRNQATHERNQATHNRNQATHDHSLAAHNRNQVRSADAKLQGTRGRTPPNRNIPSRGVLKVKNLEMQNSPLSSGGTQQLMIVNQYPPVTSIHTQLVPASSVSGVLQDQKSVQWTPDVRDSHRPASGFQKVKGSNIQTVVYNDELVEQELPSLEVQKLEDYYRPGSHKQQTRGKKLALIQTPSSLAHQEYLAQSALPTMLHPATGMVRKMPYDAEGRCVPRQPPNSFRGSAKYKTPPATRLAETSQ